MKLFKIGDPVYGLSLQQRHPMYKVFPQREQYLMEWFEDVRIVSDIKTCDAVWVDNPIFCTKHIAKDKPIVFDAVDWYEEMVVKEGRLDVFHSIYDGYKILKRSKVILVSQSPLVEEYMTNVVGITSIEKAVIPNGYDERLHRCADFSSNGNKVMLFAGKMGRWYSNLSYFIQFVKENKDWEFRLFGDGEMRTCLESLSDACKNITFYGQVSRKTVAEEIKKADVCVFPVDDCSPIVVSEYMACARPVVNLGTRLGWLVTSEECGWCLKSPNEIPEYVGIAYERRKHMGLEARKRIEPFSWRKNAQLFEDTVRKGLDEIGVY